MGSSKRVTVGYRYFMGLHFGVCYGPVDSIRRLVVGDREAFSGEISSNSTVPISQPNLFGGDQREGGIVGDLQVLMGGPTQTLTGKILAALGAGAPAFRRVLSLFYDGQIGSNNPYVKPFSFEVARIRQGWHGGTAWYPERAAITISGMAAQRGVMFALDSSGSMSTIVAPGVTRLDILKSAMMAVLDGIAADIAAGVRVDLRITRWSAGRSSFTAYDATASDITSARTFVNATTAAGGTNFNQAMLAAVEFFAQLNVLSIVDNNRQLFFVTDGAPDPLDSVAAAVATAAQLIGRTGAYTVAGGTAVDIFGVNIGLSDTSYTAQLDNTPEDGVPVIADNNSAALANALSPVVGSLVYAMNPAHIIYQCQTDPDWGMGYPPASMGDSFAAAADTFFGEGLGLCLLWNQQDEIGNFVQMVLDHCGANLYEDPATGKFELKLLRGDYDPASLPVFDPSTIIDLESWQRVGYGDTVNEITVVYRDVATGKDASITVQDLANIQAQGGVVSETRQYPGIPLASLAARIAQRDLIAASTPLAKGRMSVNRSAWSLVAGDVLRLTWPKLGLTNVICRVLAVDYGDLRNGAIGVELAEDVFGLPASSYAAQQPSGWVPPTTEPTIIALQAVVEVPYWTLARELTAADLSFVDADAAYLAPVAARPASTAQQYRIWSRVGAAPYEDQNTGEFVPAAMLSMAVDQAAIELPLAGAVDLEQVAIGDLAIVGSGRAAEWVEITAIDAAAPSITVNRGMLDTTPSLHAIGDMVFFTDTANSKDETERATGETVDFKLATIATGGELDYALATTISGAAAQRQYRPYAPGNLRIDGVAFPTLVIAPFIVTWAHRDRVQQTAYLVEQTEASIGPEAGTTYNAFAYDHGTGALLDTLTGISGTNWSTSISGTYRLRIEIEAQRDGVVSWQRNVRIFDYVADGRLIESSAIPNARITEAGGLRDQE